MAKNSNLVAARAAKSDEFYTQLSDIEREMRHYRKHFEGKTVYLNCDDPRVSNFFHYFSYNFEAIGLKKLIAACYKSQEVDLFSTEDSEQAVWLEYEGDKNGSGVPELEEIGVNHFKGNGDFRSAESIELLKQADIVVTNPPFSLFREYVAQLMEYEKKFIIIGPTGAVTYKELFPLFRENKIWLGNGFQAGNAYFATTHESGEYAKGVYDDQTGLVKFRNVSWFTNLDIAKRHEELILWKPYDPEVHRHYDNYDAIEIARLKDIPVDWDGAMGVPITFMDSYNPDQFEILGITDRDNNSGLKTKTYSRAEVPNAGDLNRRGALLVDGKLKSTFARLLIRKK
ncbi:adenine-specific methyltransferase EcoRI family protein [Microbacterium sp. KR10-403]|uniref:adenine-specific methyltransferase EcoRI family protein n=1 Tax=Microbacterium sp. KR10-403 TaxID=3158581 RepID=UPI0032E483D0